MSPSNNLVITCIEDHPKAIILLRMARKRAREKGCHWRAVFIDTAFTETSKQSKKRNDASHERMLQLLRAAEQMGGQSAHIEAQTLENGLTALLKNEVPRIELVIIGSTGNEGRFARLRAYLRILPWMRLARLAKHYTQVEIVPLGERDDHKNASEILHLDDIRITHLFYGVLAVAIASACAYFLESALPTEVFRLPSLTIALLFMIACAFVAGRFGLLSALAAAAGSFLVVNYYFTEPYHILKISTATDLINMGVFLSAALLISLGASQNLSYAKKASLRALRSQALFNLYRTVYETSSREQFLEKLHEKLEQMLEMDVAFFLPLPESSTELREHVEPAYPKTLLLEDADRKALEACWHNMQATGIATPFNPDSPWHFEPMIAPRGEVGILGTRLRNNLRKKIPMDAYLQRLIPLVADQTAALLEHITLEQSMEATRVSEERDNLRSMLLSGISHDLKTPIAGIIGALSVHHTLGTRLTPEKRNELIEAAIEEAQRLDNFITNILDMTRLESGIITFNLEWQDMESIIENATKRLSNRFKHHELIVHPLPAGVEVNMDAIMTAQVLQNVLDNCCRYTAAGTPIEILCIAQNGGGFLCIIRDHGKGIPPEKLEHIFDKYDRIQKRDMQIAGTGLGLAISKTIMEAQGGWIKAANHPKGGAEFTLFLPQWRHTSIEMPERMRI